MIGDLSRHGFISARRKKAAGAGDTRSWRYQRAVVKRREGRVPASLVPRDQDDLGAAPDAPAVTAYRCGHSQAYSRRRGSACERAPIAPLSGTVTLFGGNLSRSGGRDAEADHHN